MSIIQDFEKLHITYKTTALTILAQMPLFFISIYLFCPQLILKVNGERIFDMDFIFIVCICFSLSLTWFFMNVISAFIIMDKLGSLLDDYLSIDDVFKTGTMYSISYLSLGIFINYKAGLGFYYFLLIAYSFIVVRALYVFIAYWIYTKKRKKNKYYSPQDHAKDEETEKIIIDK